MDILLGCNLSRNRTLRVSLSLYVASKFGHWRDLQNREDAQETQDHIEISTSDDYFE